MLKRLATLLLAVAVIVSMTMQVIPRASAMPWMSGMDAGQSTSDMSAADDMNMADCMKAGHANQVPCKGMTPECIDLMGCVVATGVPVSPPASAATSLRWVRVTYMLARQTLRGGSVEPEIFPPILSA
jgi:hypothetical protein